MTESTLKSESTPDRNDIYLTCYDPLRLSLRLQIGSPKGEIPSLGGVTSERPLQLVVVLLPVSRHCCSVYTWVNLRQVGRLCVTCTPHIFPSCVSQWPQAMQPASHSTFVHGPGSHLCTMCTMVDPSLPSARPRDVGQSGISAPPHVHSYIAYAIKLTPLQAPYYVHPPGC